MGTLGGSITLVNPLWRQESCLLLVMDLVRFPMSAQNPAGDGTCREGNTL
jgi:hypothetical protein